MFTGIVEEVGKVASVKRAKTSSVIKIGANTIFSDIKIGDSVSVEGVCLTVTSFSNNIFTADVMEATMAASTIGYLKAGSLVNLERAMAANGRFGGHIVTGHIDGTGTVAATTQRENSILYTIRAGSKIMRYIIKKGSIAIDGISLTVIDVAGDSFSVGVIPHTQAATTLQTKRAGDMVNLENDIIGKYIERLVMFDKESEQKNTITEGFLMKYGFNTVSNLRYEKICSQPT